MKIASNNIENFLKYPPSHIKAVLIYGPDLGMVSLRSRKLAKTAIKDEASDMSMVQISYDNIKNDPQYLASILCTTSLFCSKKAILVYDSAPTINKDLTPIILSNNNDNFLIFSAGDLSASSSLRQLFEKESSLAAIPCYKEDQQTIKRLLETKLKQAGFSFDNNALEAMSQKFMGDQMVIISELGKLITYMGDNKFISLSDVDAVITDNKEAIFDNIYNDLFSKDLKSGQLNINRALNDGTPEILIMRAIGRYLQNLYRVKKQIINGINEAVAISSLKPPLFYKQVPIFKKHLQIWTIGELSNLLHGLLKLEQECKDSTYPSEIISSYFFTQMAKK